jgi:hypothetical protein
LTRIAGVPEQLRASATVMSASAPELELAAAALAAAPLPEMPAGVAASVMATLREAAETLHAEAGRAQREGLELKRRGLWLEAAGVAFEVWNKGIFIRGMAAGPLDALDLVSRRRAADLFKVWANYEKRVIPFVNEHGEESEAAALRKLFFYARNEDRLKTYDRYRLMVDEAGDLDRYEEASGVPLAAVRELAGKWLGPIGAIGGIVEMIHPEHGGAEGIGDRASGAAAAVGGGLSTYTTIVGLETAGAMIPGVDVIAGTLLLASAGWEAYTHRKAIAHAVVEGGSFLIHHPAILAGPLAPPVAAAQEAWDHRKDIAHGLVSAGEFGEHRAEDAAHLASSGFHKLKSLFG